MKRLHLVLLLAGVLAVGSAFTTTKAHKAPCDNLPTARLDALGQPHSFSEPGGCNTDETKSCIWGSTNQGQSYTVNCNEQIGVFVPEQ